MRRLNLYYHQYVEESFFYTHELQGIGKMVKDLSLFAEIDPFIKR